VEQFFLLHLCDHAIKGFGIELGEICQDLAVDGDTLFLQGAHDLRVGKALRIESGIDLYDPEIAAVALLVAAVRESVCACVRDRFVCGALVGRAAEAVALGLAQNIASGLESVNTFLYACHGGGGKLVRGLNNARQKARALLGCHVEFSAARLLNLRAAGFLGIEVVLARAASKNLARLRDFEPLRERLIRFHGL